MRRERRIAARPVLWIGLGGLALFVSAAPIQASHGPHPQAPKHPGRHEAFMVDLLRRIPPEARHRKNPHVSHAHAWARGKRIYEKHCLVCHGPTGRGDGPAARALNPRPADFTDPEHRRLFPEGVQYWIVTHGWPGTAMPAFRGTLSEDERWHVVVYIQGFHRDERGKGVGDEESHRHRADHGHAEGGGGPAGRGH